MIQAFLLRMAALVSKAANGTQGTQVAVIVLHICM